MGVFQKQEASANTSRGVTAWYNNWLSKISIERLTFWPGRAWTVHELRGRDWETLQRLWWVCVKERNRLATEKLERARQKAGYGDVEGKDRDKVVQETMKAIIDTLAERNNAYQEAYELARNDPTIDLTRTEHQYQESPYEVDVSKRMS